jgi:hypothetical protein
MDYICAITGSLSDNETPVTETGPLGWVKITIERQVPNPEYAQLQAFKMAVAEQQFQAVKEQLPEGDAQAEAEVRMGIDFSIRAQYAALEATIEEYTSQYEEVYISTPEEDEDVLEVLNEIRDSLGLLDGQIPEADDEDEDDGDDDDDADDEAEET